jgi:hypothetical protein
MNITLESTLCTRREKCERVDIHKKSNQKTKTLDYSIMQNPNEQGKTTDEIGINNKVCDPCVIFSTNETKV